MIAGDRTPAVERFATKVMDVPDGCRLWMTGLSTKGYGKFLDEEHRTVPAHRWAWENEYGPLNSKLELHHKCGVKSCTRVEHLIPLNSKDHKAEHRVTQCKHGHFFTDENTIIRKNGRRTCRECNRTKSRNWQRQNRRN